MAGQDCVEGWGEVVWEVEDEGNSSRPGGGGSRVF